MATCTKNAADPHVFIWNIKDDRIDHVARPTVDTGGADSVGDRVSVTQISWIPDPSSNLLVFGLSTGAVVAWDVKTGKEFEVDSSKKSSSSFEVSARGGLAGLCICTLKGKVYRVLTCGPGNEITNWEVHAGRKNLTRLVSKHEIGSIGLTAIGCSLDGEVVVTAGETLKVWSTSVLVGKPICLDEMSQCAGHASPVCIIEFSQGNSFFATAADSDRYVCLWGVKKSSETVTAMKVFSMESAPASLKIFTDKGQQKSVLSALSIQEFCHVWRFSDEVEDEAYEHASYSADVSDGVFAFSVQEGRGTCCLAAGSTAKPAFLKSSGYSLSDGSGLIEDLGFGAFEIKPGAKKSSAAPQKVNILGPSDIFTHQMHIKARDSTTETLGDQIAVLDPARALRMEEETSTGLGDIKGGGASADSLSLLLQQALTSGDNEMMEHCLSVHDSRIISTTVAKLQPAAACSLLKELTSKIERRPSRSNSLLVWVRALLLGHTSFIISLPNTRGTLHALRSITEARVGMAARLERLSGRLDLVMAQIDTRKDYLLKRKSPEAPNVLYNESDEDSLDMSESSEDDSSEEDDAMNESE